MVQPCRAGLRPRSARALPGVDGDVVVVAARAQECRLVAHPLGQLEPVQSLVEGQRPLQVGNLEVDVPDPHAWIYHRFRLVGLCHMLILLPVSVYDLVIVGGGAAGSEAAFSVADHGRHRILLAEARHFGGTCTNHGCVPTKALVHSARVAHTIRQAGRLGGYTAEPRIDWPEIIARAYAIRDHMLRFGVTPFHEAGVEVRYPARAVLTGER